MYVNYQYPSTAELISINAEKIQLLERQRPTFQFFPVVESDAWRLEWEQRDNWRGLQQLRGLNGQPSYVKMVGRKRFSAEPGVFGEFMTLDEKQLTIRANPENPGQPVRITDLVTERQDYLNNREMDLIEYIHWALLLTGTYVISGPTGAIFTDQFPIQTVTFSDWTDHANATPLKDLASLALGVTRGTSTVFDSGAVALMNLKTVQDMLFNTNPNDLGGMRVAMLGLFRAGTPLNLADVNDIFRQQNVPIVQSYDETYITEAGVITKWIPDNVASIVGRRTNGDPVGEYRMVRNMVNGGAPGRYEEVLDYTQGPARKIPPSIEVHRGHNGGPVLFYPSAIVRANT
jgi:hypothetical protein